MNITRLLDDATRDALEVRGEGGALDQAERACGNPARVRAAANREGDSDPPLAGRQAPAAAARLL